MSRQVPGRKTDVTDAAWLCQLAEVGFLKANFVPPKPVRQLRNLTRYRKTQIQNVRARSTGCTRPWRTPGSSSTVWPRTSSASPAATMLDALVAGETNPDVLAELARKQMRKKIPALREALAGHFDAHHRMWIGAILRHIDFLDEQMTAMIEGTHPPFRAGGPAAVHDPRHPAPRRRVRDR